MCFVDVGFHGNRIPYTIFVKFVGMRSIRIFDLYHVWGIFDAISCWTPLEFVASRAWSFPRFRDDSTTINVNTPSNLRHVTISILGIGMLFHSDFSFIVCEGALPVTTYHGHYHGQMSQNAYTRGLQHKKDLEKKREKPLWKHCVNEHNGEMRRFEMIFNSNS